RLDVNEMNVQPINVGGEVRNGVYLRLAFAPVVLRPPVSGECLSRRELYSLGCICNRFSFRPLCRFDAPAQLGKFWFRKIHVKRTNAGLVRWLLAASLCTAGLGHG